jgi:hypothetical protein
MGTGGSAGEGGAGGEGGGTGTIACEELGCMRSASSAFCGDVEGDTWICTGSFNHQAMIDAGCVDLITQVPRYCCPDGVCR